MENWSKSKSPAMWGQISSLGLLSRTLEELSLLVEAILPAESKYIQYY